jgi:hypothetical protein
LRVKAALCITENPGLSSSHQAGEWLGGEIVFLLRQRKLQPATDGLAAHACARRVHAPPRDIKTTPAKVVHTGRTRQRMIPAQRRASRAQSPGLDTAAGMKIFSVRRAARCGSERRGFGGGVGGGSSGGCGRCRRYMTAALLAVACLALLTSASAQDVRNVRNDTSNDDNGGGGGGGTGKGNMTRPFSIPSSPPSEEAASPTASPTAPPPRAARRPSFPLYAAAAEGAEARPDAPLLPPSLPAPRVTPSSSPITSS